jgi:hypothetical protein|tara:strand:+ start:4020 stop:5306 length:1287 start_codon:yes stop_codon:yes gene_type:complete
MEQEQEQQEENVGSSLINALFEAAEEPAKEEEVEEQQTEDLNVYGLSDAIEQSQDAVATETQEVVEEKQESEPEKLSAVDKALFEGSEPEAKSEPEPEPEPEPEAKPEQKEEEDLGWLTEDQKSRLELIDFAEGNFDEYKGKRKEYLEFFKAQKEYIEARINEDPNASLDDSDYDYQNFLNRKKPKFSQEDLEKVVEKRTRTLAKQEAMEELRPELNRLKEEQRKQKIEPKVAELKSKTMSDIKNLIPKRMKELIDSKGVEAAYEANPVEYEIVNRIVTAHQTAMFAFHEIANGLTQFDQGNPDHARLARWIDQLESTMPPRDGKKFVNINQYNQMTAVEKNKVYTLTPDEIVDYANEKAGAHINNEINAFEEKLRKSGYTRNSQVPTSQPVASTPKPIRPAPREGHVLSSPKQSTEEKNPVLSALGL